MRNLLLLLSLISCTAFSQATISFPEDLAFDPLNANITYLGYTEVIQYKTWPNEDTSDSAGDNRLAELQYIIRYDSLDRLESFRYDFDRAIFSLHPYAKSPYDIPNGYDSTRFYFFDHEDSIRAFKYYEHVYNYEGDQITSIDIQEPIYIKLYPTPGVLDGVYIKPKLVVKASTEYIYNSENLIQSKTIRYENGNIQKWEYTYKIISEHGNDPSHPSYYQYDIYLLELIKYEFNGSKCYTHIEYRK